MNFLFAACKPCLLECNALNQLNKRLDSTKFQLISITYETHETILRIKNEHDINFTMLSVSKNEFRKLFQISGCPVNAIEDKSGIVRYWKSGGELSQDLANDFIHKEIYPRMLKL